MHLVWKSDNQAYINEQRKIMNSYMDYADPARAIRLAEFEFRFALIRDDP